MRRQLSLSAAVLLWRRVMAEVVYITDLAAYTSLAPCAQSALYYGVQRQTYDACPEAVTELQGCVCTKNNNLNSIASEVSSSVSYSCGSTASEDQSSASVLLSAYCDQGSSFAFQPPATPVSLYITDIEEFQYLAPCAQDGLSYAIGSMTYARCNEDATALATCACLKNQNSLLVSQLINTSVKYQCSSMTADVSSAQAMFAAYCALNNGTSSFPVPANPPGSMTYSITDLPEYSSLAPCAQDGLSYAVRYQSSFCPEGPMFFASCVCMKDGMTNRVMSSITSSVKYQCSSTASDDVSSAMAVYDYYCSAARAEITAAGVSVSLEQSAPTRRPGSGNNPAAPTGSNGGGGPGGGSGPSNGGDPFGGLPGASSVSEASKGPNVGLIAGAAAGGVVFLALVGLLIFFLVKSSKKRQQLEQLQSMENVPPTGTSAPPPGYYAPDGKQELHSESMASPPAAPASPSLSMLKATSPSRVENVSPMSAHASAFTPPPNGQAELADQPAKFPPMPPNTSELHAQGLAPAQPHGLAPQPQGAAAVAMAPHSPVSPNAPELYGQGAPVPNRPELQGQGAAYPGSAPANMSELQGQGSHFHNVNMNRPELQGQNAMYAPPPNRPELAGGAYGHPGPMSPVSPAGFGSGPGQSPVSPYAPQYAPYHPPPQAGYPAAYPAVMVPGGAYGGQSPRPGAAELQPTSWQSGPVPGMHEMDGSGYGQAR